MSSTTLLRDPEDRNDLMGGMTARPLEVLEVLAVVGILYDSGGRDFLSSDFAVSMVLGNSNSRCPCAESLTALSVKRRLIAGRVTDADCDCDRAAGASPVLLCVSGNDAGRFEAVADASSGVVFVAARLNLRERVPVAPPVCFDSNAAGLSGRVGVLLEWWRPLRDGSGMRWVGSRGRSTAAVCDKTGASGVGWCSDGSEMRSFRRSTKRNAGSLDELWFWRCACRTLLSLLNEELLLRALLLLWWWVPLLLSCASRGCGLVLE
jgi:hypothetical protein